MRLSSAKKFFAVAIAFLVLSVTLGVASIFPIDTGTPQSSVIIDDVFHLSPNEVRRQGVGAFEGGENLTLSIRSSDIFVKNFSVVTYNGFRYNISTTGNISHAFTAGADYYEAIFAIEGNQAGNLRFQVYVEQTQVVHPLEWLSFPAKMIFLIGLVIVTLGVLKNGLLNQSLKEISKPSLPSINPTNRRRLVVLVVFSLVLWFTVLALNPNPLGTFENWYTDHARHPYMASLFLKDGLSVFNQPLDALATQDRSPFMFVTWPEMPHLYPVGSIAIFLPFGALLQSGIDSVLVFKLEIALFLVFAHVCLYFFLRTFFKMEMHLFWKLVGLYIVYVTLIIYAADGMFDAVAFIFVLLAVEMFLTERYDRFFLLVAISILFKYQAGIFLFPLIVVGVAKLLHKGSIPNLIKNKAVVLGVVFVAISGFTAYLSAPYLIQTRPELVMNGINAFTPHAQIPWTVQSSATLATLAGTIIYAAYMLKKNSLLSLSAIFLLLPSFTLPYFQNWYLPFLFVYVLIPQRKEEVEATIVWLIFMIFMLSFGGIAFNPLQIIGHFQSMLGM